METDPARTGLIFVTGLDTKNFEKNLREALDSVPGVGIPTVRVSHAMVERTGGTFYTAVVTYFKPQVNWR